MKLGVRIPAAMAQIVLRLNPFARVLVMCRGYSDDDVNFTELVWADDRHLDFFDQDAYPEFQLWIR